MGDCLGEKLDLPLSRPCSSQHARLKKKNDSKWGGSTYGSQRGDLLRAPPSRLFGKALKIKYKMWKGPTVMFLPLTNVLEVLANCFLFDRSFLLISSCKKLSFKGCHLSTPHSSRKHAAVNVLMPTLRWGTRLRVILADHLSLRRRRLSICQLPLHTAVRS